MSCRRWETNMVNISESILDNQWLIYTFSESILSDRQTQWIIYTFHQSNNQIVITDKRHVTFVNDSLIAIILISIFSVLWSGGSVLRPRPRTGAWFWLLIEWTCRPTFWFLIPALAARSTAASASWMTGTARSATSATSGSASCATEKKPKIKAETLNRFYKV